MNRVAPLLASCALLLAACPPSSGPGRPGGSTENALAFCESYAGAVCDGLVSCGTVALDARGDCAVYMKGLACSKNVQAALAGRLAYDAEAGRACLDDAVVQAVRCVGLTAAACSDVFKPAAATGAACQDDDECAEVGAVCTGPSDCARVCTRRGGLNQPCTASNTCDTGLWCDRADAANPVCRAPQPVGSTCTDGSFSSRQCDANGYCDTAQSLCVALPTDGQPCRLGATPQCANGLYCDTVPAPDLCKPFIAVGQPCSGSSVACGPDATCGFVDGGYACIAKSDVGGACTSTFNCKTGLRCAAGACAGLSPEGGPCTSGADCATGLSCDTLVRTCQTRRSSSLGQPCTGDTRYCASDALCQGVVPAGADGGAGAMGTCQSRAAGSACTNSSQCPNQTFCETVDAGACLASALGSPCTDDDTCLFEHRCAQGACAERTAPGQPCTSSNECARPYRCLASYVDGGSAFNVCRVASAPGEACLGSASSSCQFPYVCSGGVCTRSGHAGESCYAGLCLDGACQGGRCGAFVTDGGQCNTPFDCPSLTCGTDRTCADFCGP